MGRALRDLKFLLLLPRFARRKKDLRSVVSLREFFIFSFFSETIGSLSSERVFRASRENFYFFSVGSKGFFDIFELAELAMKKGDFLGHF